MTTAAPPFTGTYELDRDHSTFQFAVGHVGVSTFRASFHDIDARLAIEDDSTVLEGRALASSVSISTLEFRDHVVNGADFFDAGAHPLVTFRSSSLELRDDGAATVSGALEIRGVSRFVVAEGTYEQPRQDPFGTTRVGLELSTTIDRREWGMGWQMPLPDGGEALDWDVELTVHLELTRRDA
jgi:polyisoprenoid-binding protein YceI